MGADMIGFIYRFDRKAYELNASCLLTRFNDVFPEGTKDSDAESDFPEDPSMFLCDAERFKEIAKDFHTAIFLGRSRDLCARDDPTDTDFDLIFAGDMSWGDPPEGLAWQTLNDITRFDLTAFFYLS